MHEDVREEIEVFYSPRELFTQTNEINPKYLANEEANYPKPPQENGAMPPLST